MNTKIKGVVINTEIKLNNRTRGVRLQRIIPKKAVVKKNI